MQREMNIKEMTDLPLFRGMQEPDIRSALACVGAFQKSYKKEEYIFLAEDRIKCVGVVQSGCIHMIREDLWGNKTVLVTIGEKELFGESFACGSDLISSVSFVAKEPVRVLFLPFDRVLHSCSHACAHHQKLIVNMVTLIAEKNVAFISKIDIMSKKTIREKIIAYLSAQASYHNAKYFTIPFGRVQLAEYLGVDRSAMTRELGHMKEEGLIDFEKNTFRILKALES